MSGEVRLRIFFGIFLNIRMRVRFVYGYGLCVILFANGSPSSIRVNHYMILSFHCDVQF